jgi:hypothetical protein
VRAKEGNGSIPRNPRLFCVLARIRRDLTPFDALVVELGPLLDAVAGSSVAGTSW